MAAYKKQPLSLIGIIALLLITLLTAGAIGVTRLDLRSRASFSDNNADVIVVGAGTGGIAAAIQAARMGARVILLEETDWIGGQMTAAGVANMDGGNFTWTGGIYAEFIGKIRAHYRGKNKSIGTCYWSTSSLCFEPGVGKTILNQMIEAEPNISLRLRSSVVGVNRSGKSVTGVHMRHLGATSQLTAPVVIDATEYGDVIALADTYRIGNGTRDSIPSNACIQDITYTAVIKKYPDGPPQDLRISAPPPGYTDAIKSIFRSIVSKTGNTTWTGSYPVAWPVHNAYRGFPDSASPGSYDASNPVAITKTGVNWANDYPRNAYTDAGTASFLSPRYITDKSYRKQINCEAKLRTIQFLYYVQTELGEPTWSVSTDEGYDTPYNSEENTCDNIPTSLKSIERQLPVIPYVREGIRGIGPLTLTAKDIRRTGSPPRSTTTYPSTIGVGDYPDDLHGCRETQYLETSMESAADTSGSGPFQIPLETLYSRNISGLLFAEKNISVTRLVNGATRLQPITMVTGQAVGALAALSSKRHLTPSEVPVSDVQRELVLRGAYIVPFTDVANSMPEFSGIQLAAAQGIMNGYGNLQFGPNTSLSRDQASAVLSRAFDIPAKTPATETFTDVPKTHPFFSTIEGVAAAGVTSGCSLTPARYCPEQQTTYGQFAIFLFRLLKQKDPSFVTKTPQSPTYPDLPSSHMSYPFAEGLAAKGIKLYCDSSAKTFCPDSPIPRKQAAQHTIAILEYLQAIAQTDTGTPPPSPTFSVADLNGDGTVSVVDYTLFMTYWYGKIVNKGDLNEDGQLNTVDYTIFMNEWDKLK